MREKKKKKKKKKRHPMLSHSFSLYLSPFLYFHV